MCRMTRRPSSCIRVRYIDRRPTSSRAAWGSTRLAAAPGSGRRSRTPRGWPFDWAVTTGLPLKRYQYRYALFSASGFTSDAEEYALAQQISLVDLRAPSFAYLLTAAERLSRSVIAWAERTGATPFPTQVLREAMRVALGTWSYGQPPDLADADQELVNLVAASISDVVKERQLWLAFPSAPFVLALQPDDPVRLPRAHRCCPRAGRVPAGLHQRQPREGQLGAHRSERQGDRRRFATAHRPVRPARCPRLLDPRGRRGRSGPGARRQADLPTQPRRLRRWTSGRTPLRAATAMVEGEPRRPQPSARGLRPGAHLSARQGRPP